MPKLAIIAQPSLQISTITITIPPPLSSQHPQKFHPLPPPHSPKTGNQHTYLNTTINSTGLACSNQVPQKRKRKPGTLDTQRGVGAREQSSSDPSELRGSPTAADGMCVFCSALLCSALLSRKLGLPVSSRVHGADPRGRAHHMCASRSRSFFLLRLGNCRLRNKRGSSFVSIFHLGPLPTHIHASTTRPREWSFPAFLSGAGLEGGVVSDVRILLSSNYPPTRVIRVIQEPKSEPKWKARVTLRHDGERESWELISDHGYSSQPCMRAHCVPSGRSRSALQRQNTNTNANANANANAENNITSTTTYPSIHPFIHHPPSSSQYTTNTILSISISILAHPTHIYHLHNKPPKPPTPPPPPPKSIQLEYNYIIHPSIHPIITPNSNTIAIIAIIAITNSSKESTSPLSPTQKPHITSTHQTQATKPIPNQCQTP
ncbi:hypothetical protein EYC84_011498 [Monilinia fructicola]|uniref:Uncharacterized protein n=1 Tax=Monilinia fructicola TaxID=38448 RepID=A0A5M9J5D9_MONFR|nr:hypothetical protein EYC84_011498 [Monilinia fructicola]